MSTTGTDKSEAAPAESAPRSVAPRARSGEYRLGECASTVLFVDDDAEVLERLGLALHGEGYRVLLARSGEEALALVEQQPIDVVVADEVMPGMQGTELLAVLAREHPDVARVLLTGKPTVDAAARAINEARVFRFVQKPCSTRELRETITAALDARDIAESSSRLLAAVERQVLAQGRRDSGNGAERRSLSGRFSLGLGAQELEVLSEREREVLTAVVDGLRVTQIAHLLFLSQHTVRNHLKAIFRKLGAHSQSELIERYGRAAKPA